MKAKSILQFSLIGELAELEENRIKSEEREETIEILSSIFQEVYDDCIDDTI